MSTAASMTSRDVSPRMALIAILVVLALSGGVIFAVVRILSGSAGEDFAAERAGRPRATTPAAPETAGGDTADDGIIVQRNLFRARGAASKPIIPAQADVPPPVPDVPFQITPVTPPPVAPPPAAPRPTLAYTGNVEIGDEAYALIENLETKLAEYARVGSMVYGYTLKTIQPEVVTLEAHGHTVTLNLGANKVEEATTPPKTDAPAQPNPPAAQPANTAPPPGGRPSAIDNGQPTRDFRGRGRARGAQEGTL
ncbi:MAG TPA: hypothetical protein PLZ36_00740 [Armatimonadota bacterium]|nr:hypothetical protein [Armatimonadota bacterium]HOS42160.1 hypothetical protein [Armatimonadota bacterium]